MPTRLEKLRTERGEDWYEPELPPIEAGEHLVGYLFEVGPTVIAGMGTGPVTYQELQAWQEQIGLCLEPWELRVIRRLSIEYLNESHRASKAGAEPPWIDPESVKYKQEVLPKRIQALWRE